MAYLVNAYHITESLKLKKFASLFPDTPFDANAQRIVYQLSEDSFFLVFNFGSVVFFNVEEAKKENYLTQIKTTLAQEEVKTVVTSDDFSVEVDQKVPASVEFTKLTVKKLSKQVVELVSLVLAQSTALEFFENEVVSLLKDVEKISLVASKKRLFRVSERQVIPLIESTMRIKRKLIGSVYLLEKPEMTWTSKEMDELYGDTSNMFELRDRFKNLDYELKMLQEDMSLLASFTSSRQMLIMEASIVGLFILDLILLGYEVLSR